MYIADNTSNDVNTNGGGIIPPSIGFTPDALLEVQEPVWAENSQTGVSTKNASIETKTFKGRTSIDKFRHWYALRATYGREKKAYEYLSKKKVEAFYSP